MSLDRKAAGRSPQHDAMVADRRADPFSIVAGLIVAILFASLLLWLNGGAEINGAGYGIDTFSEVAIVE